MRALIAIITAVTLTACAHRPAIDPATEHNRLEQRQATFLSAFAARDLDQATEHFATDAVLHVASMPAIRGRSAIREFYGNVFRFMTASEATPETTRLSGSADMAYTVGRVTNTFRGEQGPVEYEGKYLLGWERREGTWSIVFYSISSNRPDTSR